MKLSEYEDKILVLLFNNSLTSFTIYSRLNIPFEKFYPLLKNLIEQEFLIEKDEKLLLTKKANEYLLLNKRKKVSLNDEWKKIPKQFIEKKIKINEKYIPNIYLLDDKLRNNILEYL